MSRERRPHEAYPVRTVARLTGLSPDIIRAWEKRYRVVAPMRGPRGARLYTADDVRHLRLLGQVVASGRAIGDVAELGAAALAALLTTTLDATAPPPGAGTPGESTEKAVAEALAAIERFDAAAVERRLGDALIAFGDRLGGRAVADRRRASRLERVAQSPRRPDPQPW
jgi:DNA-binding transcriptional MerR regulator